MTTDRRSPTVVVGICTYQRPQQLGQLLKSIAEHVAGSDYDVRVLVVDDDPAASALDVASAARDVQVSYKRTGSRNLSTARNNVLETAMSMADYLALIDDDCLPAPGWIEELVSMQRETGADIVTGQRSYRTRPAAPTWLSLQPFCEIGTMRDGEEPDLIYTANVLLRTAWFRTSSVRFRASLGTTGGEDMTFLSDSLQAGAVVRASTRSVVHEPLTPERESYSYHVHRQFWLGNNMVVINRHTGKEQPLRLLLRGLKRVFVSLLSPVVNVRHGQPPQFRWAFAYAAQGAGLVMGVAGLTVDHRS